MNRTHYLFIFFSAVLSVVVGVFQSVIYLRLGTQTYTLDAFPNWFICMALISLIFSLIMMKYYHYKKFAFAFWSAVILTIVSVLHFIIIYGIIMGATELRAIYLLLYLLVLAATALHAVSLLFSQAGKRPWLRVAGVVTIVLTAILLSVAIWSMGSGDIQVMSTAEKIDQWVFLVRSFIPALFMMNALGELKRLRYKGVDANVKPYAWLETGAVMAGIAAVPLTLIFALQLYNESHWAIEWNKEAMERSRQLATPFEARTYVSSKGDTMRYRLLKPFHYDSTKRYPLVVCLHHGGTHGTDNVRQIDGSEPAQLLYQLRTKYPAFLFVPQCPQGATWGGLPHLPAIDSLVFETIGVLEEEFAVDEKRRYVTGISGGGYGSWYFIGTRPEMFAAAIPICGGADPDLAPNMVNVPVWAFHGEEDRLVPVKLSRDMIQQIENAGGSPRYTEFPGAGHNIWDQVNTTPGLMDWLFAQKRD